MMNFVKDILGFVFKLGVVVAIAIVIFNGLHIRKVEEVNLYNNGYKTYDTVELHNGKVIRNEEVVINDGKELSIWLAW